MLSQLLSILTCLAMLWHIIGGCCWHHVHQDCDQGTALCAAGIDHHPPGMRPHCHINHDHHEAHQSSESAPLTPAPCTPSEHCTGETCVYLKSFSPDVTNLFALHVKFMTPVTDLVALQSPVTLPNTDRVVLHNENLSALHHCALTQSWLL